MLSLHLATPQLQPPALQPPRLMLARFEAPSLRQVVDLQLPPPAAPVTSAVDPYKGSLRLGEVGTGVSVALLGSAGALAGGTLVALALSSTSDHGDVPASVVAGGMVYLALQLVVVPPLIALAAYAFADLPLAGSLGRAVGYAYAGQGMALGLVLLGALVAQASNSLGSAVAAIGVLSMELVGIPILASLGLHGGDNALGRDELQPLAVPPSPEAPPPQLMPPPLVPGSVPTLPPTALELRFRF